MTSPVSRPASRPVVGLSVYREQASWGAWTQRADLLPAEYARWVEAGGGTPVLLPPSHGAADIVGRLDALIISGGADVSPARYGVEPHPRSKWRDDRDEWEFALLDAAPDDLPVLGICRGMQVMAVHAGGSLRQHVPDDVGHENHSPSPTGYGDTGVTTVEGTLVRRLLGPLLTAHCHHHQSVASHPGFVAAAHAPDGTLEAMEHESLPRRFAVQWHPETDTDLRLIRGLLA